MDPELKERYRSLVENAKATGLLAIRDRNDPAPAETKFKQVFVTPPSPPPVKKKRPSTPVPSFVPTRDVEEDPNYQTLEALLEAYPPDKGRMPTSRLQTLIRALPREAFVIFQRLMSHQRCMNPVLHWTAQSVERVVVMLDTPDNYESIQKAVERLRTNNHSLAHSGTSQQFWNMAARNGVHYNSKNSKPE